jgi:large subunit ribosomal protein L21
MYAVIESGGKQFRVELGSQIQVDHLDVEPGDSITLDRVLLVADGDATAIGQPVVDGALVSADVVGQVRGQKVVVFKYKPKARTRVKKGFRAELTTLRISDIAFGGKSAASDAKDEEAKVAKASKAAEKAAADKAAADAALAAKLAAASEPAAEEAAEVKPKAKATRKKSAVKAREAAATPEATSADAAPESATEAEAPTAADSEAPTATDADSNADDSKKDD